jgi:hypothetical protein
MGHADAASAGMIGVLPGYEQTGAFRKFWQIAAIDPRRVIANKLLTPNGGGILFQSFRLQGHELFREGSGFFAGLCRRRAQQIARDELMP